MAHLRANVTPAAAPGGHEWNDPDDVVEVPDELANELLRIAGMFSEVLPGDDAHPGQHRAPEDAAPVKRGPGRPRKHPISE